MSLASKLATPPGPRKGPQCSIRTLLKKLSDAEADAVQGALDNPDWEAAALARLLTQEGHRVAGNTIRRHRRGDCLCAELDQEETQ